MTRPRYIKTKEGVREITHCWHCPDHEVTPRMGLTCKPLNMYVFDYAVMRTVPPQCPLPKEEEA